MLTRTPLGRSNLRVVASSNPAPVAPTRRDTLLGLALLGASIPAGKALAAPTTSSNVSSYLPPSETTPGQFFYKPKGDATPSLRANVYPADSPYSFSIPGDVKPLPISNTQTGNFCMPGCAEPWLEAVYEDDKLGRIEVQALPLNKLTRGRITDITGVGSTDQVLTAIGPYLTGAGYDPDEVELLEANLVKNPDRNYYFYSLTSLYPAKGQGGHILVSVATKGEVLVFIKASANDKQWPKSQGTLRASVESFRA